MECFNCGKTTARVLRVGQELWLVYKERRALQGPDVATALQWRFGTAYVPPMDGPPPDGGRIFTRQINFLILDPRSEVELTRDECEAQGWENIKLPIQIHSLRCPHCAAGQWLSARRLGESLDIADARGRHFTTQGSPGPRPFGPTIPLDEYRR